MTIRPPDGCGAGRRSSFRCGASFFMAVGAHASFLIRLVMGMPQEGALARRGCAIRTFLEHINRPTQRFPTPPQVRCPAVPHALQHGLLIRIIPMLTRPGLCNTPLQAFISIPVIPAAHEGVERLQSQLPPGLLVLIMRSEDVKASSRSLPNTLFPVPDARTAPPRRYSLPGLTSP